jgi:hypothetical protein
MPQVSVVTVPMRLTPVQKMLLDNSSTPDLMVEAIAEGVFYAEVIESTTGVLNPGTVGYGNKVMPSLYATLAEAQYENLSNIEASEKSRNRRDADAGWKGVVVKVLWDGGDDFVVVDVDTDKSIAVINWREACGL